MKIVPARSVIQPMSGQSRISLLAMKRVGQALEIATMSTQETWLEAIMACSGPPEPGSGPSTRASTARMASRSADQRW